MDARDSASEPVAPRGRKPDPMHTLWLASPLVIPLLYSVTPWLPEPVGALAGLSFILIAPGWLLHLLLYPQARIGLAARVSRAFALSVTVTAILGLVVWFIGGGAKLGPVDAADPSHPPVAGRLTTVLWGHVAWLLVGSVLLATRSRWRRWLPGGLRAGRRSSTAHYETLSEMPVVRATVRVEDGGRGAERGAPAGAAGDVSDAADRSRLPDDTGETGGVPGTGLDPSNPKMQRIIHEAYRLGDQHKADHPIAPRWATLLVLGVMMLTGSILGFYAGGMMGYVTDAPDHLACIREMIERDQILPRSTFYIDGDGATVDARKGFFHVAIAAAAVLTHTDPVRLWHLMPGLLIPLALVVFHSLARRLLRSEGTALFATFLALICFAEVTRGPFARLGYGSQMGVVLAWGTLALALDYVVVRPRAHHLWLMGLAACAAIATHLFAAVLILFSLGVFLLAMLLLRRRGYPGTRRLAQALGATLLGSLPFLVWRLIYTMPTLNPVHTHRQGIVSLTEDLYILLPSEWSRFLMGAGFGAVVLSLFLWKRARDDDSLLYMASLSAVPVLIVANPVLVPLLEPYLGYLVARFVVAVPYLMVLAYMARWMGESLLELTSLRRILVSLVFYLFMVLLLFPRLESFARSYSTASLEARRSRSVLIWEDLLQKLDSELPTPAVVLSDPLTAYSIPAMTRHYTVSVLHQHASPSDSLAVARLAACRDVLSPYVGAGEKARICRRFGVDYVLVNEALDRDLNLFFATVGPDLAARQRRALEAEHGLFRKVWDLGPRGACFQVRRDNVDALAGIVLSGQERPFGRTTEELTRSVLLRQLPPGAVPIVADTTAGITLMAASLDTTLTERGSQVGVTLYWQRVGQPPQFPVDVHLRLDTAAPRGALWSLRLSKIHRHVMQRLDRTAYRLHQRHVPLQGMLGVERWPTDRYVVDRTALDVPEFASPGEYEFKVFWLQQSMLPNVPLEHFMSDRDAYDGATVGYLEVY